VGSGKYGSDVDLAYSGQNDDDDDDDEVRGSESEGGYEYVAKWDSSVHVVRAAASAAARAVKDRGVTLWEDQAIRGFLPLEEVSRARDVEASADDRDGTKELDGDALGGGGSAVATTAGEPGVGAGADAAAVARDMDAAWDCSMGTLTEAELKLRFRMLRLLRVGRWALLFPTDPRQFCVLFY
jgi:hypothetical protein